MDEKNSKTEVKHPGQRYPNTIHIGNWEIEINDPVGFVVRNLIEKEEYHFFRASNGWATGVFNADPLKPVISTFNSRGARGMFAPVLCDIESTKAARRRMQLVAKFKDGTIASEEKEELLKLEYGVV